MRNPSSIARSDAAERSFGMASVRWGEDVAPHLQSAIIELERACRRDAGEL